MVDWQPNYEERNFNSMIEEHAEIGRPFQCAGLVNPPAMQMVGLEETMAKRR